MSTELRGTAAAPGVASGAPWIYRPVTEGGEPVTSIADAASVAVSELDALAASLREAGAPEEAEILDAQALMALDPELIDAAAGLVAGGGDAVASVLEIGDRIAVTFASIDDEMLAARAADVRDVSQRIARHLSGVTTPRLERRSIVVADDLAPSVTVELDRAHLAGIALQGGSRTSHAVILARSLDIPAVVGVAGLVSRAERVDEMALDGDAGLVILDPDDADRQSLRTAAERAAGRRAETRTYADRPLATADGHRVACAANIGEPGEAATAIAEGAEGIGLFRTEFAFAGTRTSPDQATQASAYRAVLDIAGDRPVVFRLADIGGDKPLPYVRIPPEANPFLGVRAIRLATTHPSLYADQVRAILRAATDTGRTASIMAPMVADEDDVGRLRELVAAAMRDIPDARPPRVGIMVEIPSAVLLADRLAPLVDFMSIGTNDLTQYLMAADRTNAALSERQDPLHPAVLRAVQAVVEGARDSGGRCEVAVCGEMAGDAVGAQLLVGLGVDELSMGATSFNAVKSAVAGRSIGELRSLAVRASGMASARDVRAMMVAP
ncbi:MAG: phosphoenolpyruvate--protein phosphotransferase [Candidatus Limnocylindria bacterium]